MAYISQEEKKELAPAIKSVLKKYGVKGTIGIRHYSTLMVNISEGDLDFIRAERRVQENNKRLGLRDEVYTKDHIQVNLYNAEKSYKEIEETRIANFFAELIAAMKGDKWYDKSDPMTDYFNTAYYLSINIGKWNNPYKFTGTKQPEVKQLNKFGDLLIVVR